MFITIIITLSIFTLGSYLLYGIDVDMRLLDSYRNKTIARNSAEMGYEWIQSQKEPALPYYLVTHKTDESPEADSCLKFNTDTLDPSGGLLKVSDGWIVREGRDSAALGGFGQEEIKIKIFRPADSIQVTEVRAKINGKDSITLVYNAELVSISHYSFFAMGDIELAGRKSTTITGNIFVNGNLYLSPHESYNNQIHITARSLEATGNIYRYNNALTSLSLWKSSYINSHKTDFIPDMALSPKFEADLSFLSTPGGSVYINDIEMELKGPNTSDDSKNPDWNVISKKWNGVVRHHSAFRDFKIPDLIPDGSCQDKGSIYNYKKLDDLLYYTSTDEIFNSAYGHYTSGHQIYRKGPNGANTLANHIEWNWTKCKSALANGPVNPFYITDEGCSGDPGHHNWYGGVEGGQWVIVRVVDLSLTDFYPGKEAGTLLDAGDYNLLLKNASLLLYPITIKTNGEVYIMGDYNIGIPHDDIRIGSGGAFAGTIDDPDTEKNIDQNRIVPSAVVANKNYIWYLSYDWALSSYGHFSSSSKKGMAPLAQRKPRKRPDKDHHNAGTYVGVFVSGAPQMSESFWLSSNSHGVPFNLTQNTLEDISTGVSDTLPHMRFYGTRVMLQNGVIDTSGMYGEGAELFTADFDGYLKGGDKSITHNGKIPPKYANSWHSYPVTYKPYSMNPPGFKRFYKLASVTQK